MPSQHADLDVLRWESFSLDQQILMIANEMNRAGKLFGPGDRRRRCNSYARVLRLADLTVAAQPRPALRRELLRWRDLVAWLFASPAPDPGGHRAAFRCLLQFTPAAARQIAHLNLSFSPPAPVP
jgi:hypothetical protein